MCMHKCVYTHTHTNCSLNAVTTLGVIILPPGAIKNKTPSAWHVALHLPLTYIQIWPPAIKNKDLDIIIRLCNLRMKGILCLKGLNSGLLVEIFYY